MIARLHARHAGADFTHDAGAFMTEDRGEETFRVETRQGVLIGVADTGRLDLDQHLASLRSVQVELDDLERFLRLEGDSGAGFQKDLLPSP